jgi:hypothetical protein
MSGKKAGRLAAYDETIPLSGPLGDAARRRL